MNAIQDRPAAMGNFSEHRKGRIDMLIIHVMEGIYGPTGAWFANPDSHVSAHYGVSVAGDIARYVLDQDTAWHAGNGEYNARSIGIELEGHLSDGANAFTPKMMTALEELCDALCEKWNILRDRQHVIGHNEVPDPRHPAQFGGAAHHIDPGNFFPWPQFIASLQPPSIGVA